MYLIPTWCFNIILTLYNIDKNCQKNNTDTNVEYLFVKELVRLQIEYCFM